MIGKSGRSAAYVGARPRRPWRVLPLAIGAVIATLSVAAVAGGVSRDLSKGRYAAEILRDAVTQSNLNLPKI
jgi:hypothetical protein